MSTAHAVCVCANRLASPYLVAPIFPVHFVLLSCARTRAQVSYKDVLTVARMAEGAGRRVTLVEWEQSGHVDHLLVHGATRRGGPGMGKGKGASNPGGGGGGAQEASEVGR